MTFANTLKTGLAAIAMVGAFGMTVNTAIASTVVNCPGTVQNTDREFSITPNAGSATCLAFGTGNISGENAGSDPLLTSLGASYSFIGKWTTETSSNLHGVVTATGSAGSGTWAFTLLDPPGYVWENLVLALKSGNGQLTPTWAAFALSDDATSGAWTISAQGLSHINLYGQLVKASQVPLPAGAPLLLAGLAGLAALRRKRRTS
ncbi:MAG: VPLPA-CTERM sorting domain-containing protein [bacterium]